MGDIRTLPMEAINATGGTQSRAVLDQETVTEYGDALGQGAEFPPVIVFSDGTDGGNWLADGFHRFHAHRAAGLAVIACDVRVGTRRDAVLFSVGANASHGLRRTNEDKRRAVMTMLADEEWKTWSQERIAKACHVSAGFVSKLVNQVSLHGEEIRPASRTVERNGKTYEMNTSKIGQQTPAPQPPPAAPPNLVQQVLEQQGGATVHENADAPDFGAASLPPAAPAAPLTVDDIDDDGATFDVMERLIAAEKKVEELERERDELNARVAQFETGDLAAQIVKLERDLRIAKDRAERRYNEFTDANKKAIDRANLLDRIRRAAGVGKDVDLVEWVKQAARRAA